MITAIKDFSPSCPEVTEFRTKIFVEDLGLHEQQIAEFTDHTTDNKLAYWYGDHKFLSNGYDRVLLFYHEGKPVGMVGGTHFNKNLYRGIQGYYILKSARKISGLNTLHFRHNGFFDWQIKRAKELQCKAIFISFDLFDRRHEIMYNAMKNNVVGPGHMPNEQRKYTTENLIYPEEFYSIKYVQQKVCYFNLINTDINFDNLFYDT